MNEISEPVAGVAAPVIPVQKRPPVSDEEKAEWAKRFLGSGLSLRTFSLQNGLSYMSLWRWANKAGDKTVAAEPAFTEIKGLPLIEGVEWAAELSLPNGTVLRLSRDVPPTMVDQLLRIC